ncbi:hypothetical protein [Geothrix campi]|uniref:hypothetical protein n=1 Tax=Geothrix campi TaxID=2966450 RepID=UPI002149119B|nr:hypothetical protein [Geothrix sp. SG10]
MAWNGTERRARDVAYAGPDRRRGTMDVLPEDSIRLRNEQMLRLVRLRHMERATYWDASEFLE